MKKIIGIILTIIGGFCLFFALIFGLVFGGIGISFSSSANSDKEYDSYEYSACDGIIISSHGSGDSSSGTSSETVIAYYVDGLQYTGTLNLYSSDFTEGDTVLVYYEVNDPSQFEVPTLSKAVYGTLGSIFSIIGIAMFSVFGLVGIVMLVVGIILIKSAKKDLINS